MADGQVGKTGLHAVLLVEAVSSQGQGHVPTPNHRYLDRIAMEIRCKLNSVETTFAKAYFLYMLYIS